MKNTKKIPTLRFSEFLSDWKVEMLSKFLIPDFREVEKPSTSYLSG